MPLSLSRQVQNTSQQICVEISPANTWITEHCSLILDRNLPHCVYFFSLIFSFFWWFSPRTWWPLFIYLSYALLESRPLPGLPGPQPLRNNLRMQFKEHSLVKSERIYHCNYQCIETWADSRRRAMYSKSIRSLTSWEWFSVCMKQHRKETHQLYIAVLITQQNACLLSSCITLCISVSYQMLLH